MVVRVLLAITFLTAVPFWIWSVGGYSLPRDGAGLTAVTVIMLGLLVRRHRGEPRPVVSAMGAMVRPWAALTWMLACWVTLSLFFFVE